MCSYELQILEFDVEMVVSNVYFGTKRFLNLFIIFEVFGTYFVHVLN
jgi:hypothetical protein